jgi:hypothetical protein
MANKREGVSMSRIIPEISTTEKLKEQEIKIWHEMAHRYVKFHNGEDWDKIRLWGLFYRSEIKPQLEKGQLIPYGNYGRIRCLGWYEPSEEAYNKYIKPLIASAKVDKNGDIFISIT